MSGDEFEREEWRELGFCCECNHAARQWRIIGSRDGLQAFATLLREYAADPRNATLSEHEHYGPFLQLEIGTWSTAVIDDHWIAAPLPVLTALADRVERRAEALAIGASASLRSDFAPDAGFDLLIQRREDTFDPGAAS